MYIREIPIPSHCSVCDVGKYVEYERQALLPRFDSKQKSADLSKGIIAVVCMCNSCGHLVFFAGTKVLED